MPYGPSVPHMFIVVFLIMLPIYLKTHDPVLAWQSGLVWCLIIGVIVLIGAFVGPTVRKYTPRAAMLGTLAGISIAFISMRPAFLGWEDPWLFMLSLTIVLVSWMAGIRLPFGLPGGLAAVVIGTVLGWLAKLVHLDELMQPAEVAARADDGPGTVGEQDLAQAVIVAGRRSAVRSRRPYISAIPEGRQSAAASDIRWRQVW